MSYAYSELYIDGAQRIMGDMFDFAVHSLNIPLSIFFNYFVVSGMARQFEIGNPTYIAGKNGCEVARDVAEQCKVEIPDVEDAMYLDKSEEYWIGWSLAYYQWESGVRYIDIVECVPIEEMYAMYPTLHEEDISSYIQQMNDRIRNRSQESRLKRLRFYAHFSQNQLAKASGVPLRQIQLFEQGQRDIRKTQGDTLQKLAKTLHCQVEDLLQ